MLSRRAEISEQLKWDRRGWRLLEFALHTVPEEEASGDGGSV